MTLSAIGGILVILGALWMRDLVIWCRRTDEALLLATRLFEAQDAELRRLRQRDIEVVAHLTTAARLPTH